MGSFARERLDSRTHALLPCPPRADSTWPTTPPTRLRWQHCGGMATDRRAATWFSNACRTHLGSMMQSGVYSPSVMIGSAQPRRVRRQHRHR